MSKVSFGHNMFQDVFKKLDALFADDKDVEFSEEEKSCINEKISSKLRYSIMFLLNIQCYLQLWNQIDTK